MVGVDDGRHAFVLLVDLYLDALLVNEEVHGLVDDDLMFTMSFISSMGGP